jgi:hypothetical protein
MYVLIDTVVNFNPFFQKCVPEPTLRILEFQLLYEELVVYLFIIIYAGLCHGSGS